MKLVLLVEPQLELDSKFFTGVLAAPPNADHSTGALTLTLTLWLTLWLWLWVWLRLWSDLCLYVVACEGFEVVACEGFWMLCWEVL